MALAWWLNALALAFVTALGVRALFNPKWAARFLRLNPDAQAGGFVAFRAAYGGIFAAAHGAALLLSFRYIVGGELVVGMAATGAAAALAAGWAGGACGRALSMWRDGVRTRFNKISAGVEAALALAIAAPWLVWYFGG